MWGQSQSPGQYLLIFLLGQKFAVHILYMYSGVSLEELDKPVIDVIWDFKMGKFIKQSGVADCVKIFREIQCKYYYVIVVG